MLDERYMCTGLVMFGLKLILLFDDGKNLFEMMC